MAEPVWETTVPLPDESVQLPTVVELVGSASALNQSAKLELVGAVELTTTWITPGVLVLKVAVSELPVGGVQTKVGVPLSVPE